MSDPNDYYQDLLNIDNGQGAARLRTLALEFHDTLVRLPKIKQEIDRMLEPQSGINYDELVARIEPQLELASEYLMELDTLAPELRNSVAIKAF